MRREVLFEIGLAYGLRRVLVPVVASQEERSMLPSWLNATQLGYYSNAAALSALTASVSTLLSDLEFALGAKPANPVPGLAVWLRTLDWNKRALEQFKMAAQNEGLAIEVFNDDAPDEIVVRRAGSANLLVVSLDGTASDALMHFLCGAVAAKPKAGYGGSLKRTVLVLEPPDSQRTLVAEGLRRCPETVKIIPLTSVHDETIDVGKRYGLWLSRARKQRKKNDPRV
jgi:hypothetical protein